MENENIQPILFAGPEVCVLEDYISKTNFDKFLEYLDRQLSGESSGLRVYLVNVKEANIEYVKVMIDLINVSKVNMNLVATGNIKGPALFLLSETEVFIDYIKGCKIEFNLEEVGLGYCDLNSTYESRYQQKEYYEGSFLKKVVTDVEGIIKLSGDTLSSFVNEKNKSVNAIINGSTGNVNDSEIDEEELIHLNDRVLDMGFLSDDEDLSDEEFISHIKDSLYGEYTKDDLEEFKSVLIKKELYHRIGLVNQLIQEMK